MKIFSRIIVLVCLIALVNAEMIDNLKFGVAQIMQSYDYSNGLWDDADCVRSSACSAKKGFWYWANTMHVIADYQALTGDVQYLPILKHTLEQNRADIIGQRYFDDEGWWALAFLAAYQATGDASYLNAAKDIVNDMESRGAQNVCGNGGIYWDSKKTQVGSIANELFISVNAKLYLITKDNRYKQRANSTWKWLKHSGLVDPDNNIADHYKITDGKCGEKVSWRFTYTNGVLFGALADLSRINHDPSQIKLAKKIAQRSMYDFTQAGVLTEPCTNVKVCADDAFLFKGVFVHELAYLAINSNDDVFTTTVVQYLQNNYNKLIANQGDINLYAFSWGLPIESDSDSSLYNPTDIVTELSALYLMEARIILNNKYKHTHHNFNKR